MDRNIKMIRQLEQVFEPYCMMFRELRGKKKPQWFYNKKRENKEEKEKKEKRKKMKKKN
jgi:hypothetical protein